MLESLSILWLIIATKREELHKMSLLAVIGKCSSTSFLQVGKVVWRTHTFLNVHEKQVLSSQMGGIILLMPDFLFMMHF